MAGETSPRSQAPRGPAPPQPAVAGLPSRLAQHPSAPGGRPPHVPGSPGRRAGRGALSASAAGSPRLLPFLEGRGRRGRGGRCPARPRLPAPPAAPGAGPAAALPGLRGSLRACHFLPGREGGGCRLGAAGRAGGGGWRGGASGAAGPLPRPTPSPRRPPPPPPRVPRFLPAPVAMTTPLPGLCALGPGVVFFFPVSLSLSPLFFPLLSLRVLLAGWRDETEKVLASSGELTSHRGEGDGRREGSDVKRRKKKVFSGASGNKA